MEKLSKTLTTVTTGINKYKPTVRTIVNNCTTGEVNLLLKECSDLISPTFKDWYARQFYALTHEQVMKYASQARVDGKSPAKLFSYLLSSTKFHKAVEN